MQSMAQEGWKKEIDETECQTTEGPILCANNCGFFGSSTTNNLCSKCYRDLFMKRQFVLTLIKPVAGKNIASESTSMHCELIVDKSDKVKEAKVVNVGGSQSQDMTNKQPSNRCLACKKRVGLSRFKCRCGGTYCSAHRYSETHECSFDYRSVGQEVIVKSNPLVKAENIKKN